MLARIAMVMAIAALALLIGAPEDALACHKGDPGIPHGSATSCGGKTENILSPVLVDGNLEPIGTVVGVTDLLHVITLVEVQNDFDETRLTALQANWKQVENNGPFFDTKIVRRDVAFDGLGCTGQAFITPNILVIRITDTVFASAVTGGEWYVATSTNEVLFVRQSLLVPGPGILDSTCQTPFGPFDQTGAPAEQVEFNIFDRFPLPYTLELR